MNNSIRICGMAVLSALLMLSLSGGARAGDNRDGHSNHKSGHSQRGYPHGYSKYQYRYAPRHYHQHKHHNNGNDNDDDLLIGLLVGGVLGYAVGNYQGQEATYYYPPTTTLPPPQPEPYPATRSVDVYQHGTCLQEREYQTTVTVGGKQVQAYGTACLQPDGSWRRGPAQMAAY